MSIEDDASRHRITANVMLHPELSPFVRLRVPESNIGLHWYPRVVLFFPNILLYNAEDTGSLRSIASQPSERSKALFDLKNTRCLRP